MHRANVVVRMLVRPASNLASSKSSVIFSCQSCKARQQFTSMRTVQIPLFSSSYYSTSTNENDETIKKEEIQTPPNQTTARKRNRLGSLHVHPRILDPDKPYTANTYISVARAKELFPQLTQAEFEGVPRYQKRPGTANWFLKDELEKKAQSKFRPVNTSKGTLTERLKQYLQKVWKKKNEHDYIGSHSTPTVSFQMDRSQWLIVFAVSVNLLNSVFKFFAYSVTNSHAIWAEMIHSIADTVNQLILLFGVRYSLRNADSEHPYGWYNMRNVASLLSGFGIFFFGAGLSFYDGIHALLHPELMETENISWALMVLLGSLISEGGTLYMAARAIADSAKESGVSFYDYVRSGQDPSTGVILQEDAAAVLGVLICGPCVVLSHYLHSPMPDAIGSLCVGALLAGVACSIIKSNTHVLLGRSAPDIKKRAYMQFLEEDPVIRYVYDVKATYIEGGKLRYKAEISLDGEQVVASYINKLGHEMERVKEEMMNVKTIADAEDILLKHGECMTDMVGEEVDRIEKKTKHRFPEIRHLDLEVD